MNTKARTTPLTKSENEQWFLTQWKRMGGPIPEMEFRFHPTRKWRADFAWPDRKTILEIQGFGHQKHSRYHGDIEKMNAAQVMGWRYFQLTYKMIAQEDLSVLDALMGVLSDGK